MIYFIQADIGGPVKIGHAKDVRARLRDLQCGSPFELRVLWELDGDFADERALHERFADRRLHGEWFKPCEEMRAICRPKPFTVQVVDRPVAAAHRRTPRGKHWPLAIGLLEVMRRCPDEWWPVVRLRECLDLPPERGIRVAHTLKALKACGWVQSAGITSRWGTYQHAWKLA